MADTKFIAAAQKLKALGYEWKYDEWTKPAPPTGCYPEEWGPSTDRRLTCACGNVDPFHWEKAD